MDALEERALLSGTMPTIAPALSATAGVARTSVIAALSGGSANYSGITPANLTSAYGVNSGSFDGVFGDGTGQTTAIVDAYNDPNIGNDVLQFDNAEDFAHFSLSVVDQSGGSNLPANAPGPSQ